MSEAGAGTEFARYCASVYNALYSTTVGLWVTGINLFRKPVTEQYPTEKPALPQGYRGIHVFEMEKCISCGLCATACPVECILIASTGKGKNAQLNAYQIDYNRCMFCGLCVEACPANCLHMGLSFDLTRYTPDECVIDFVALKKEHGMLSPHGDKIEPVTEPG